MYLPCLIFNINVPESFKEKQYENNKNNNDHYHLFLSLFFYLVCLFSRTKENFLITASQDRTIKVWLLPKFPTINEKENQIVALQATKTEVAHDKVIH